MELFWNSLDNAPFSIVFYLEKKVEVEVGVQEIGSRSTPRVFFFKCQTRLRASAITMKSNLSIVIFLGNLFTRVVSHCLPLKESDIGGQIFAASRA